MLKLWNKIMKSTYDWCMGLVGGKWALPVLCAISFIESSFFPIPPDLFLIPLILTARTKAFKIALSAENALLAAKRELLEETGYESDEWNHLITVPSNATMADNYAHLYVARNCRRVSEQSLDETEFLNVMLLSAQEIEEMIEKGEFQQAIHIMAWLLSNKK